METKRHSPLRAVASIGAGASVLACHGATWMLATSIDAAVASNTSQPRQTLHEGFIDKTPAPDFAGFHRSDDGMRRGMKVRSSVTVLRVVAAAHMPTRATDSKMNPGVAEPQTVLATTCGRHVGLNGIKMCASCTHGCLGSRTVKVLPRPGPALNACTVPRCNSTMRLTTFRPMPTPRLR